ncbi:MAG: class I SAM-dependent methyltransferase [Chloroflexi bacterium]|nr:MAG: class I SAM-dependent methyltransferase [Chloroflexota bacterium]
MGQPLRFSSAPAASGLSAWEAAWSPYDEETYRFALSHIGPEDVVLDIGAGDLRLARRLAGIACHVTAIEINPAVLALSSPGLPPNLSVICADARHVPFPSNVTVGVLLMRHCEHFRLYVEKLRSVGCRRLITNARWRMGVEVVDLGDSLPFEEVRAGWYACKCGAVGIVPGTGPDDFATPEDMIAQEVEWCPACRCVSAGDA